MKEFFKKHLSTIVACIAFTFVMLLQLIFRNMYVAFVAFGIAAIGLMFGKKEDRLPLLLFTLPFSRIFVLDIGQISLYTVMIFEYIVLVVLDLFIAKKPIPKKAWIPILIYAVLGVYVLLQYVAFRKDVPINRVISIMMYASMPLFYYIDCNRLDDSNKEDIIKFLLFGFCASLFLSALSYIVPRIETNLYYLINDQVGIIQGVRRFSGLLGDSNYYAFYTLGVVSLAVLNLKTLKPKKLYLAIIGFLFVVGFLTLSMMYFLIAIILLVILFVQLFKAKPKIGFISLVVFCGVLFLAMIAFGDKIMGIVMAKAGSLTINDITTGRWEIWMEYIKHFFNNPFLVLTGHGISANTANYMTSIYGPSTNVAAHNMILELLYDYGIIGGFLLLSYYVSCLSCYDFSFKKILKNKKAWFFLVSFVMCGMAIELIESDYVPFFWLILALTVGKLEKIPNTQVVKQIENKDDLIAEEKQEEKVPKEKKSNRKTVLLPLVLSAVSAILSFAFSFFVAKPLGTELYGKIEYYIGIISVTSLLLGFGLPSFLNKETQFSDSKEKFFSNVMIIFSIVCAIGIPVFLLIGYFCLAGLNKNISIISLIYIASIFTSLGNLVGSYYIGRKEASRSIIFSTIVPHGVILVMSLILLLIKKEELPNYYIYISIFAYIVAVVPCLVKNLRKVKLSMTKKQFTLIASFYIVTLTSSLYTELSKILQGEINNSFATVGILSISVKVISVISIFLSVISKITMPEFANYANNDDYDGLISYYQKVTRVNSYVVIPFLIAIAIQGRTVLGLFGADYTQHMWIFWFLVGSAFIGHVTGPTGTMLLMTGHEKYEIFNGILKMVVYLAIGIPLGLHYVWGLPLAVFAADGLINFVKFIQVKKVTKRHPYTIKMLIQVLVLSAISVGVFLLTNMIHNIYLWFIANAIFGCGLILAFFFLSPYKDDKYFLFKKRNK